MAGSSRDQEFFHGLEEAQRRLGDSQERDRAAGAAPGWRLLAEVTDLLNSPIDRFDAVLEAVLDATIRTTGADRGFLMLADDAGQLEVRLARNLNLESLPEHARRISRTIVEEVVRTEEGVCIADVASSGRFADSESVHDLHLLSVMCVPLKVTVRAEVAEDKRAAQALATRKILGVVYVDAQSVKTTFREADLELFTALANAATTAIVHAETFRQATTDELTRLATRRHFERRLRDEVNLARRSRTPLSLLLIDVDRLREVNQGQGYEAGDDLLRGVARVLRSRTRALDTSARYGGEEFSVLLPETNAEGAEEVARKIMLGLQDEKIAVSIGIATLDLPDEGPERLVRRADQALARAKEEGGGRARPFTAELGPLVRRADKLAGIFSGDAASVYRNVLMLLETIPAIHAGSGLDRVLPRVVEGVVDLTRAERGFVFLRNERGELTARVGRDRSRREIEATEFSRPIVDQVVASGEPLRSADGGRMVMCVPLAVRRTAGGASGGAGGAGPAGGWGAVYVDARAGRPEGGREARGAGPIFDEGALAFMAEFARQAAIAIENARLLEENQEKARKIEKLVQALEQRQASQERALETAAQLAADVEVAGDSRRRLEIRYNYDKIVGESASMRAIFKLLDKVTDSTVPVFIYGESGTGKELVAKAIHFNGPRRSGRFIAENCAALTETLLESELFGAMKGAFTGAVADKKGLFELASGGTIFLDEVGDMTPAMQMKLLRVLQEGEVRRVGGKESIKIDVRAISASNKDLKRLVEEGKFREDLFYRLNVVRVALPPLRERREDIPLLVDHFVHEDQDSRGRPKRIAPDAMELLMRYPWPGNIRELKNVIERAKILSESDTITLDTLIIDTEWAGAAEFVTRTPAFPERSPIALAAAGFGEGRGVDPQAARRAGIPGAQAGDAAARARAAEALSGTGPVLFSAGRTVPPPPPGLLPGSVLEPYYFELNERQRKLVEYLQTYGSIRNRDYYEIMGVSKSTGWRDLKDLMDREIVIVHGKGKGSIYSLHRKKDGAPVGPSAPPAGADGSGTT